MKRWVLGGAVIAVSGLVVVVLVGADPVAALVAAADAAFGSALALQETLAKSVPLLFCGLAVALSFRAGVWNIGAEGQLLVGAAAATWIALSLPPGPWSLAAAMVAGAVGGALWAGLAAALRELRGVNEILSTILLNLVAVAGLGWLVHGPLQEPGGSYPQSALLPTEAWLWRPLAPGRAHLGLVLAAAAVVVLTIVLRRTAWGLELRATGASVEAARACGVRTKRVQAQALVLSGMLAGLGGAVEVAGITHRLFADFSPGWGYSGIAVALLGGLAPLATAAAALLFGAMAAAAGGMQRAAGVPAVAVLLIQGVVVMALACTFGRGGGK